MLSSIIKGFQPLNIKSQDNTFSFQKGKIFFGQVKNIYPNNFALLQIGNQSLIAKLEVPLTNGESYWFQVDSDDGAIQLKLLSNKQSNNNMTTILKQLSLPATKTNLEIAYFLSKEQIPFTKESISKISGWLSQSTDIKQDIKIVKQMLENDLPLNESIFKSLLAGERKEPIHYQLQNLQQLLSKEAQTPTVKEIQAVINSITNIQNKQIVANLIQDLKNGAVSDNKNWQKISSSILQKLGKEIESPFLDSKPTFQSNTIHNQLEGLREQRIIDNEVPLGSFLKQELSSKLLPLFPAIHYRHSH